VDERDAAVAMIVSEGIGPVVAGRLRRAYGSYLEAVRNVTAGRVRAELVSNKAAERLRAAVSDQRWREELRVMERAGARFALPGDPDYTCQLAEVANAPIGIFVKGASLSDLGPMVAIVGSRRATPRGRAVAGILAGDLAREGLTVVSGMARGIDTVAHTGALEAGGNTVAVLGCGLCRTYPPENAALASRIAEAGAVVSEFPMRTDALPGHFPRRNRIVAGLSAGVIVVEAAERSGALITAACALEQGREVFAVPGPLDERMSVGTNRLIKAGAALVEDARDVIEAIEPSWGPFERPPGQTAACLEGAADGAAGDCGGVAEVQRGSLDERLLTMLSLTPSSVDALIVSSGARAHEVLSALLRLELSGNAEKVEGHRYILGERLRRRSVPADPHLRSEVSEV
jgi:DNA processing protein